MAKKIKSIGFEGINKGNLPSFSIFNDSFQTTIFNGNINLTTVLSKDLEVNRERRITITQKNVSLSDLKINNINEVNNFIKILNKLKLNIDKTNLSNYANYGSLKEKFRFTVNNIINKFPGGLFFDTFISGISYFNILDYKYDSANDISTFKTPITIISNPFFLNLNDNSNFESNEISNVTKRFLDYTLFYNNINYGINEFTGFSNNNSSYLYFNINGNPFSGNASPQNIAEKFLVKPNDIEYNKFYDSLNELERYFLNKNSNPKYSFNFKIPQVNEDDELEFVDYSFTFPLKLDNYNLDTESIIYIDLLENLFEVGDLYDEYKSNLIIRKFLPSSIIDFDNTNSFKSESIFKVYGKEIDDIKRFIDSLMYINSVSYDKVNNIPDVLIKNLARTLGWKAQNIINDKDLLSSVFNNDKSGDTDITASLAEVDIELWRRLSINTAWFLKSKGTRKAIETIFTFIGAPDCLINFDEHVYVVEAPINVIPISTPQNLSVDGDGFPINPRFDSKTYFQINGIQDNGQKFIDIYRKQGFTVTKVVDNKKSWVYYESASTHSSIDRNTNYGINDSRLIINTKELSINLDIAKAIECDIYNFNKEYNLPVSSTGSTSPTYPKRESNNFDTTKLTFAEYVQEIYSKFINAQNRKVTDSALGSHYPSLAKLYYDYFQNNDSNKRNYKDLYSYISNLDNIFDKFIEQFIPATTIYDEGVFSIRNTIFTPQKYTYKHGIDDGSEFESEIDPNFEDEIKLVRIESELFNNYEDEIKIATIDGNVNVSDDGNIDTDEIANVRQNVNLEPSWNSSVCENEKSAFLITGGTKIELSSLTDSTIFNKTIESSHTITFEFTSNTSTLSSNTTNFYYTVHRYNTFVNGFDETIIFSSKTLGYTAFTGTNILNTIINGNILNNDTEYIIKPYFEYTTCVGTDTIFTATTPYNDYDNFLIFDYKIQSYTDLSGNTLFYNDSERFFDYASFINQSNVNTISTFIENGLYSTTFQNYNPSDDYYFVSFSNPDKPIITIQQENIEEEGLVTETFRVNTLVYTDFYLTNEPIGDIIVSVNGITIQRETEYTLNPTPSLVPSVARRAFRLLKRLTSLHNDIVNVVYYRKNSQNIQKLVKEDLNFTGSSQIVSGSSGNYEITLSFPVFNSEINIFYNGVFLVNGNDFNVSLLNPNLIVLTFTPQNDTNFSVVYLTNATSVNNDILIELTSLNSEFSWTINSPIPGNVTGNFIHQFYPISDTGLTGNTIYTAETIYENNLNEFRKIFNWSTSTPLVLGGSYFYRIASNKNFKTINNIILSSVTYSDVFKIKLPV